MKPFLLFVLLLPFSLFAQDFGTVKMEIKDFPNLPVQDKSVEEFNRISLEKHSLSSYQNEWFYWTNYSRTNPRRFWDSVIAPLIKVYPELEDSYSKSLKKDLYSIKSLPKLRPNRALLDMAQSHANALGSKKANPSHSSPDGTTFQARVQKANIQTCAGENISFGPKNALLGLVLLYIDRGIPNVGHRLSLLSASFTEMGIGISPYANNYYMTIQDFSCSQNP